MSFQKETLRLYLVTGSYDFSEQSFLDKIEQACQSGVTMVQLREKKLTTRAFYDLAIKVKKITDAYKVPLLINDWVEVALAVDAAGVHIGDDELPVSCVRRLLGKDKIIGVSAKTVDRALQAEAEGANYLGVGAIFPTQTKETSLTPLERLSEIGAACQLPMVAIGGITSDNIEILKDIPIAGIAVVSEIMLARDIVQKCQNLLSELDKREFF
ncbi:thiamine phosphate synthase [Streptococcus saliviloxodontae]|uniref:Thiamine-phosphate synthase n=1 Tax=Streptococcus saliviloxodontae TaxID=1349416 RepID=A0ABS2PM36_9STRE|nr:thiamine phosphate synthase [Streptococcus saliviloxodontae]MBM7636499.1 thiamine-phosphate pyrophosphorylase [Streptococcus saliviloxodontae]